MDKIDEFISGRKLEVSKIYGYCDWKGSNQYNDTLSQRRISEVYKYLKRKGIVVKEGYYYVLGDHRTNSADSREGWEVPKKYIVGRVQLRWWPVTGARLF